MRIDDIRLLYAYNVWANARILDAAARAPAELFSTAALGDCNLRDTLEHLLVSESIWRLRWQNIAPESIPFPEEFPTLAALRARWHEEDQRLADFLAALDDAALDRDVTYQRSNGAVDSRPLWQQMAHMVNHSTQHRSEVALLLTALGYSPGALDLIVFVREHNGVHGGEPYDLHSGLPVIRRRTQLG
jgi:uncharacterized damage-inducible protein DinB